MEVFHSKYPGINGTSCYPGIGRESNKQETIMGRPFDTQGGYGFSFSANYFFHFQDQTINFFLCGSEQDIFPPSGMKYSIALLNFFLFFFMCGENKLSFFALSADPLSNGPPLRVFE